MDLKESFADGIEKGRFTRFLYRYRPFNDYTIDELKNNYLWFSKWGDYNDPFDGQINIRQSYSYIEIFKFLCKLNVERNFDKTLHEIDKKAQQIAIGKLDMRSLIDYQLKAMENLTRTCSFSKVNNSILMWSHYINSHTGICLEFDCLNDPMTFLAPIPINYSEDYNEHNFLSEPSDLISALISRKFTDWKYEKEHRILKYPEIRNKINYNPLALKSVFFGCRADKAMIESVKNALENNSEVEYKRCILDSKGYKLNIVNF